MDDGDFDEDGTLDADESGEDLGLARGWEESVSRGQDLDFSVDLDHILGAELETWEGLEGKSWVGWRAGLDEGGCKGEDLVGAERRIESVGEWLLTADELDEGVVARFDSEDGGSSSEDGLVLDGGSGTKVSRDTDTFEEGSNLEEGVQVVHRELILAFLNGSDTGADQSVLDEADMGSFVLGDDDEIIVVLVVETVSNEEFA